ncbi:DUF3419 family protein [Streptomyces sp. NRRL F-5755]|uniref:DUF3419 family protein n=1 Tax=Streptomyces sp. NRRL F-5755 TaxID=1519475 RepID=UPI0006AE5274|nr:DUF3419 family protein [Streptomyces sp. NRRL F-5755]
MSYQSAAPLAEWAAPKGRVPVALAQVREDALQDLWLAGRQRQVRGQGLRVVLAASGGCTAAALAAFEGTSLLHLVDTNPAQLALTRLKLHLLQTADTPDRLRLLGHLPMPGSTRRARLEAAFGRLGLAPDALGPLAEVAKVGPDFCGRYERLFALFRDEFAPVRDAVSTVLALRNPVEQARRVAPETGLGAALDRAFHAAFRQQTLVRLFGKAATDNRVEPFARYFARRTRHVLATRPAADNPYLWQLLAGRFPPGVLVPWLTRQPSASSLPQISFVHRPMDAALAAVEVGGFDMVHLSNLLDGLDPVQARRTLERAWRALRPGGIVIVRQLNSSFDIRGCGSAFAWDPVADQLHAKDRSFFCRALHVGVKTDRPPTAS